MALLKTIKDVAIEAGKSAVVETVSGKIMGALNKFTDHLDEKSEKYRIEKEKKISEYVKSEAANNPQYYHILVLETTEEERINGERREKSTYHFSGVDGLFYLIARGGYNNKLQKIDICDGTKKVIASIDEKKPKKGLTPGKSYRYKIHLNGIKEEIRSEKKRKSKTIFADINGLSVEKKDKTYVIKDSSGVEIAQMLPRILGYSEYSVIKILKGQDIFKNAVLFMTVMAYNKSIVRF